MDDSVHVLQQKLEFLQLELDDHKQKEDRLQHMYDSLLSSMSAPAAEQVSDSKVEEARLQQEIGRITEEYKRKTEDVQSQLRQLQDSHRECEFSQRSQKLSYEETILELRQQIYQLNNDKSLLNTKLKLLSSYYQYRDDPVLIENLRNQVKSLSQELDRVRTANVKNHTDVNAQTLKGLAELKETYEIDKKSMSDLIEKLQAELKYQRDVVHAEMDQNYSSQLQERMDALFQQSQDELDEVKREKELAEVKAAHLENELGQIREELKHSASKNEQQKQFIRERMEKTKKLLEFASNTNEEMKKLKTQVATLKYVLYRVTISSLEGSDHSWKDVLAEKDKIISSKTRENEDQSVKIAQMTLQLDECNTSLKEKTGNFRAEEEVRDLMDELNHLRSQLADKDTTIYWLKKQIGDKKIKRSSKSHDHSLSDLATGGEAGSPKVFEEMTYPGIHGNSGFFEQVPLEELKLMRACQKMVNASASLECEYCRHIIATQAFLDHVKSCRADSFEVSAIMPSLATKDFRQGSESLDPKGQDPRLEELEKTNYELRLKIGELKNDRDKAKLECEKLLIQLKHVKLEWAMAEERTADKDLDTKRQMKSVLDGLILMQANGEKGRNSEFEELIDKTKDCLTHGFRNKSRSVVPSPRSHSQMSAA